LQQATFVLLGIANNFANIVNMQNDTLLKT